MTIHAKKKEVVAEAISKDLAKNSPDVEVKEGEIDPTDIKADNPPPYGVLTLDLDSQFPSEFEGFYTIKALKKGIDAAVEHAFTGDVVMVVEVKYIIVPPEEEEEDDFTAQEQDLLDRGMCPYCYEELKWDDDEEVWMCPQCQTAIDPEHVGVEPPKPSSTIVEEL